MYGKVAVDVVRVKRRASKLADDAATFLAAQRMVVAGCLSVWIDRIRCAGSVGILVSAAGMGNEGGMGVFGAVEMRWMTEAERVSVDWSHWMA